MALNKFMHLRNIYKTPPDFSKLAKEYKEFSEIAKVDVTGKVSIDFKNPNALRVLTKCLLKSDFNVDIIIPEDRLVPTLPLRLNYILWIEDLLIAANKSQSVVGLDIGTGACAIYPILAAVKNKWHMIGTESDEDSFKKAIDNVNRNNLQDLIQVNLWGLILITVRKNESSSVLDCVLQDEKKQIFHFCMCNPPFYSNFQDLWESRSPARPPPKNGFTGSPQELITEGGELQFCRKIIEESKMHKDDILIYTTMVGHKYNLKELLLDMQAEGIKHTTTEFCQGRVTRWGLAWTYQDYDIQKLVPARDKPRKRNLPTVFTLPRLPGEEYGTAMEKINSILKNLEITSKLINKRKNEMTLEITALTNTWCNQRRKRRLMKRAQQEEGIKKIKLNSEIENPSTTSSIDTSNQEVNFPKTSCDVDLGKEKIEAESKNTEPVIHAVMRILNGDNNISIEMGYINGSAGKEGLHQIIQYVKNNWK